MFYKWGRFAFRHRRIIPLVVIVRDPKGAEELAKALSFLIRNLQKG